MTQPRQTPMGYFHLVDGFFSCAEIKRIFDETLLYVHSAPTTFRKYAYTFLDMDESLKIEALLEN